MSKAWGNASNSSGLSSLFNSSKGLLDDGGHSEVSHTTSSSAEIGFNGSSQMMFRSRKFMFPSDKRTAKQLTLQQKGFTKRPKHSVRFAPLSKISKFDPDVKEFPYNGTTFYLVSGQSVENYERRFSNIPAKHINTVKKAQRFWSTTMRTGWPPIEGLETKPTPNALCALPCYDLDGVIPFNFELTGPDSSFLDPNASDYPKFSGGFVVSDEEIANNKKLKVEVVRNVYQYAFHTNAERRAEIDSENLGDFVYHAKSRLLTGINELKLEGIDKTAIDQKKFSMEIGIHRVLVDVKQLLPTPQEQKIIEQPRLGDLLKSFANLAVRYRVAVENSCLPTFRKAFAAPFWNSSSKPHLMHVSTALGYLEGLLDELAKGGAIMKQGDAIINAGYDEVMKKNDGEKPKLEDGSFEVIKGLPEETRNNLRGLVVTYEAQLGLFVDVFTGDCFKPLEEENPDMSKMYLLGEKNVIITRKKGNVSISPKGQALLKKVPGEPEEEDPNLFLGPELVVPGVWKLFKDFFEDPVGAWTNLKVCWMELFMTTLNIGVLSSLINNSVYLLKYLVDYKIPDSIKEVSILATEAHFKGYSQQSRGVQRTAMQFTVHRSKPTVASKHWKLSYFDKSYGNSDKKGARNILKNQSQMVYASSISVFLHPIVRADLYYSRLRHCSETCIGHRGMLLATLIRLGHVTRVKEAVQHGLSFNHQMCLGDAIEMWWDTDAKKKIKPAKVKEEKDSKEDPNKKPKKKPKKEEAVGGLLETNLDGQIVKQIRVDEVDVKHGESKSLDSGVASDSDASDDNETQPVVTMRQNLLAKRKSKRRLSENGGGKGPGKTSKSSKASASLNDSGKKVFKEKSKPKKYESDVLNFGKAKSSDLRSTYGKITPFSIAVDCAVTDVLTQADSGLPTVSQAESELNVKSERSAQEPENPSVNNVFSKLRFWKSKPPKLKKITRPAPRKGGLKITKEVRDRAYIVQTFLEKGADVLAFDMIALRACLPVLEPLAKAAKRQKILNLRAEQAMKEDLSHTNNLSAHDVKKRKPSVLSQMLSPMSRSTIGYQNKRSMSSFNLLSARSNAESVKKEYYRVSKKSYNEKVLRYEAAVQGIRVFQLVSQAAIKAINGSETSIGNRCAGEYANLVVRVVLLHEAILREKWDVVRFLAPCSLDTNMAGNTDPEYSGFPDVLANWKKLDGFTAEALKRVLELLIFQSLKTRAGSYHRFFNGIFFILKEYSLVLDGNAFKQLMRSISSALMITIILRPGDKAAIENLISLPQIQYQLRLNNFKLFESRCVDHMSYVHSGSASIKRRVQVEYSKILEYREDILKGALGKSLDSVYRMIPFTSISQGLDLKQQTMRLHFLARYVIVVKKQPRFEYFRNQIANIFTHATDMHEQYAYLLRSMAEYLMKPKASENKATRPRNADSTIILALLRRGAKPSVDCCVAYILNQIKFAVLGTEEKYTGEDIVADLSRILAFNKVANYLVYEVLQGSPDIRTVIQGIAEEISAIKNISIMWFQGLQILREVLSVHLPEIATSKENPVYKQWNELIYESKWHLSLRLGKIKTIRYKNKFAVDKAMMAPTGDGEQTVIQELDTESMDLHTSDGAKISHMM